MSARRRDLINQRDYTHYVMVRGKIESGWSYAEDATDHLQDLHVRGAVVRAKRSLLAHGIDPDDNESWHTSSSFTGSSLKRNPAYVRYVGEAQVLIWPDGRAYSGRVETLDGIAWDFTGLEVSPSLDAEEAIDQVAEMAVAEAADPQHNKEGTARFIKSAIGGRRPRASTAPPMPWRELATLPARNPRGLTAKGERMYEHVKSSYAGDPRAKEIASRTVLARAQQVPGLKSNPEVFSTFAEAEKHLRSGGFSLDERGVWWNSISGFYAIIRQTRDGHVVTYVPGPTDAELRRMRRRGPWSGGEQENPPQPLNVFSTLAEAEQHLRDLGYARDERGHWHKGILGLSASIVQKKSGDYVVLFASSHDFGKFRAPKKNPHGRDPVLTLDELIEQLELWNDNTDGSQGGEDVYVAVYDEEGDRDKHEWTITQFHKVSDLEKHQREFGGRYAKVRIPGHDKPFNSFRTAVEVMRELGLKVTNPHNPSVSIEDEGDWEDSEEIDNIDDAVDFLLSKRAKPTSSTFRKHLSYWDESAQTFRLDGFSVEEQREIFERVKKGRR